MDGSGTTGPSSGVAAFEQLRARIAGDVATGALPAGTRLATVRRAAADLGLAPGTVARAYRELEADGVVVTRGRHGTFVRSAVLDGDGAGAGADDGPPGLSTAGSRSGSSASSTTAAARAYAEQARRRGLTLPEALALVERAWGR